MREFCFFDNRRRALSAKLLIFHVIFDIKKAGVLPPAFQFRSCCPARTAALSALGGDGKVSVVVDLYRFGRVDSASHSGRRPEK